MPEQNGCQQESINYFGESLAGTETIVVSQLSGYIGPDMTTLPVLTRVRTRILEQMERDELTQSDVAEFTGWSQSKISKALHGKIELSVDDVDILCRAVNLRITEVVRDHGMEFCAEMTPTELRFLEVYRTLTQEERDALAMVLTGRSKLVTEDRRAMALHKPRRKNL